ncbi:MAG: hypothetical protein JXR76_04970 [Deltaproteobacteria bacterium]|nr:hypothetical protein [Deltaproteobacteria bacterium]
MTKKIALTTAILILSLIVWIGRSSGQGKKGPEEEMDVVEEPSELVPETAAPLKILLPNEYSDADVLAQFTPQDERMLKVVKSLALACKTILHKWLNSKAVSEDVLFSFLYYPIAKTNPAKFHTDYDKLADEELQNILEAHVQMEPDSVYAILSDRNGYVPTHNLEFSKPLTGDMQKDIAESRNKRIYADKTGLAAARNQKRHLLQVYRKDTGDVLMDLSLPVLVGSQHWGCARVGYYRREK